MSLPPLFLPTQRHKWCPITFPEFRRRRVTSQNRGTTPTYYRHASPRAAALCAGLGGAAEGRVAGTRLLSAVQSHPRAAHSTTTLYLLSAVAVQPYRHTLVHPDRRNMSRYPTPATTVRKASCAEHHASAVPTNAARHRHAWPSWEDPRRNGLASASRPVNHPIRHRAHPTCPGYVPVFRSCALAAFRKWESVRPTVPRSPPRNASYGATPSTDTGGEACAPCRFC